MVFLKLFGDLNQRELNKLKPIVDKINRLEPEIEKLKDEELRKKTEEFKERIKKGESLDSILPEAFAVVREAAKRTLGQRHFDVQLMGGIVLHQGKIAEMKTGEGKTLAATLPVFLNALEGKGVHVVTVNDYLAKRDAQWMGKIYLFLGLSVGVLTHEKAYLVKEEETQKRGLQVKIEEENLIEVPRKQAYLADITYGTNNEFGFDYLRDNMVFDLNDIVQRELNYAIIDEIDSILIDEARTPLIISAPAEESTELYKTFARIVPMLKENVDYNVDEKMRAVTLTDEGISKVERLLGIKNIYDQPGRGIILIHHLEQALKAHALFKRDRDYVVKDGEVIIVDEFTGRLMYGRRYSEGLHQAIEAKEGVEIKKESKTLATITFQNYFRMYKKLAGMTGTAVTEAEEFAKIYNLDVVVIPTNKPMIREDLPDRVYKTEKGKFEEVVKEIKKRHEKGQPVLVGTISIEKNELLSELLKREGIKHEVLNAKNHEREAQIIAQAGRIGAVTIATNMAGRGVDIILGGADTDRPGWKEEHEKVKELGGLHVIGTERHEARRIDNQLRGRAGRQGDPGSSQFFISLEDDLMRIFGSEKIRALMDRLGVPENQPIENKILTRAIESAQRKVEAHNFDLRKHVLEYDDVMNKHRESIYKLRRDILKEENLKERILELIKEEIDLFVEFHTSGNFESWNFEEILENASTIVEKEKLPSLAELKELKDKEEIKEILFERIKEVYELKEKEIGEEQMRMLEKIVYLRIIDTLWTFHLDAMEDLRTGIGLRGYGQLDPLVEYKREGWKMFKNLEAAIRSNLVRTILKVQLATSETGNKNQFQKQNPSFKKVGRNDPCPCGSGKKYKKCCGRNL